MSSANFDKSIFQAINRDMKLAELASEQICDGSKVYPIELKAWLETLTKQLKTDPQEQILSLL